jgi:oligosaccharide repeat unit polymerase
MGWARVMIATMLTMNLFYFCLGLVRRRTRAWWLLYALHFLLLLLMGLMSGSRSGILNIAVMQVFAYHYLKRPIGLRVVLPAGLLLVAAALIMGVVREGLKVDAGRLVTGLDATEVALSFSTFTYGVQALQYIVAAGSLTLAHGSTFLSLVTNAIPRAWWPEKPESGGIFFTKVYTDDAWDGGSNLTPTFIGESIINFGWTLGIAFFVIAYMLMMYMIIRRYRSVSWRLGQQTGPLKAVDFAHYLCVMWAVVSVMVGEFTNVFLNLLLTQVMPLMALRFLVRRAA